MHRASEASVRLFNPSEIARFNSLEPQFSPRCFHPKFYTPKKVLIPVDARWRYPMKLLSCAVAGAAVLPSLLLASGERAFAGVVMSETLSAEDHGGQISQNKTIYVQGNKEKIERESTSEITDLDKALSTSLTNTAGFMPRYRCNRPVPHQRTTATVRQFSPKPGKPES